MTTISWYHTLTKGNGDQKQYNRIKDQDDCSNSVHVSVEISMIVTIPFMFLLICPLFLLKSNTKFESAKNDVMMVECCCYVWNLK